MLERFGIALAIVVCLPTTGLARDVYVGVYLHDLSRFRLKDGMVDVDFEMWAKWRGEVDENGEPARHSFDWTQLEVANAAEIEMRFLGIESDRDWHTARWRVRGILRGEFPMHRFPYDVQTVEVALELPNQYGRLVADAAGSGVAPHFSLTDWLYEAVFHVRKESITVNSDLGLLEREGLPSTLHRVSYQVRLKRPILTVALKMFLPLAIIVLVALVALFLPAGAAIGPRSSIGVTALLSCFAFQFTIADTLPAVAYLTLADTLFLIAYVFSSSALVVTIASYGAFRRGNDERSLFIDRVARISLPIVAFVAVIFAVPSDEPEPEPELEPLVMSEPEPSVRDEVRIGVFGLPRLTASPLLYGTGYGMLLELPDGEQLPVLVETKPGVDNEAIRFLSDGRLEVTWSLREGLRWSDGEPIVARDLSLAWDAYDNPHVESVETPDDRTLVVTWKGRLAQALEGPSVWPSHVLQSVFDEGGYDAVRDHRRAEPVPELGPYHTVEYVPGERLVAEANEHFNGPPPAIERVVVRAMSGEELVAAFLRGEIDVTSPNSITMEQALEVQAQHPRHVHIRPSNAFVFLQPDLSDPRLGQLEFRRALLQAIDRERIRQEVYGEGGRVAHVPVPIDVHGMVVTEHDVDAARETLARLNPAQAPVKLIHGESVLDRTIGGAIAEHLRAAGVPLEVETVSSTATPARTADHGGLLLHVIRGDREASPGRYWNLRLENGDYVYATRHDAYTDEVHALVERERHALYPERRMQLRDALLALTSQNLPNLPIVFAAERILADPALRDWDYGSTEGFGTELRRWHFVQE